MTTTPTKNESLPELPEYAASLHVQHFRNAPSMRNTDFVESFDFPEGAHRLYTADQMRAYAEAALTLEAPREGVVACHRVTCRCIPGAGHVWRDGDIPDDERAYWEQRGDEFVIERAYKPASTPPAPQRQSSNEVAIVCDWKDADPFPRFIEAEVNGRSVSLEWRGREDGLKELIVPVCTPSDYPGCSGDPASCPENEGHGCCKPNPQRLAQGEVEQQTVDALVDRIDWWADKYEAEGGHAVIVQLLRQYAGMVAKLPIATQPPHHDRGEVNREWRESLRASLKRYGFPRPELTRPVACDDGYWTPWHVALETLEAALTEAKQQGSGEAVAWSGESLLPAVTPFGERIIRVFRDRPHDDSSAEVLSDYGREVIKRCTAMLNKRGGEPAAYIAQYMTASGLHQDLCWPDEEGEYANKEYVPLYTPQVEAKQQTGEGFVLVPVEPTDEMVEAGERAWPKLVNACCPWPQPEEVYAAMIAAAAKPSGEE